MCEWPGVQVVANRGLFGLFCLSIFVALLIGSQFRFLEPWALAAEYSKPQVWDELVEAARKEGKVVLYAGPDPAAHQAFVDFEKAYPGITVNAVALPGHVAVPRLAAEYRANKHLVDVVVSTSAIVLKPMGLFAPLKPALVLPEVVDTSAWWDNRLWWMDAAEPYTMLNFQGIAQPYMAYNTNLVHPKYFTSWMDLLNPRWKSKIVSTDPRRSTIGGAAITFIYQHPNLGPKYLERFFSKMDVTLSADSRQMADWLGRERFHLAFALGPLAAAQAAAQGLPVALVATHSFKEGAPMTSSGRAIALMQRAPHANAAKLYINWLLSREGQIAWQRRTKQNSLRIDIPKEGLHPESTPIPGQTYVFLGREEDDRHRDEAYAFVRSILDKRGK